MINRSDNLGKGTLLMGAIFLVSIYGLGFHAIQDDFLSILLFWLPAAMVYGIIIFKKDNFNYKYLLAIGILCRLMLVFSFPNLSDDIYRFYWDGILWTQGVNSLAHPPDYFMQPGNGIDALSPELYQELNSPEYYTIYPPILQLIFGVAAMLSTSIFSFVLILKLVLCCLELGSIFLMIKLLQGLGKSPNTVLLYALNPLVIIEITGNTHFEGTMVFFLAAGLFFLLKRKSALSAASFAAAVGSKILPLMFFPATWKVLGWKKGFQWILLSTFILLAISIPFMDPGLFNNFLDSFDLFFRKFEFNASLYYLAREIGMLLTGYNQIAFIGPALGIMAFLSIIYLALTIEEGDVKRYYTVLLFSFILYLLCSATVHPWYLTVPIFLSLLTGYRFVFIWSLTAILSYSHYHEGHYSESFGLIAIEYLLPLSFFIWEVLQKPSDEIQNTT